MAADRPDEMVVCTVFDWVWRDLRAGVAGRWPLRRDHGRDLVRPGAGTTAWWVPTGHAARLHAGGVDLSQLAAPGPSWLSRLDRGLTGRTVHTVPLAKAAQPGHLPSRGFLKAAEAKVDTLPAGWTDHVPDAAQAALDAGVAPDTPVQVADTLLDIAVEHRAYVRDGQVVTTSPYRTGDGATWEPGWDTRDDLHTATVTAFAAEVAGHLHATGDAPAAYVLDLARTTDGRVVVLEANPAWSSGTYGCDLRQVVDTVVAATVRAPGRWAWQPDPTHLAMAAARLTASRIATPPPGTAWWARGWWAFTSRPTGAPHTCARGRYGTSVMGTARRFTDSTP